jgi:hypothetical protein
VVLRDAHELTHNYDSFILLLLKESLHRHQQPPETEFLTLWRIIKLTGYVFVAHTRHVSNRYNHSETNGGTKKEKRNNRCKNRDASVDNFVPHISAYSKRIHVAAANRSDFHSLTTNLVQ